MNAKFRNIEVDVETAELLEARAAARGISVAELLADLASNDAALPAKLTRMRTSGEGPWSAEAIAEDSRRLADFERTRMGAPWQDVRAWLESWGTPKELPAPKRRKL